MNDPLTYVDANQMRLILTNLQQGRVVALVASEDSCHDEGFKFLVISEDAASFEQAVRDEAEDHMDEDQVDEFVENHVILVEFYGS